MTQAELSFYTDATRALNSLANEVQTLVNEVHSLNDNIKQLIEYKQL